MNAREQFLAIFRRLHPPAQILSILGELDEIVGRNQNRPPEGEADGSFTEEQWNAASRALRALKEIELDLTQVGWGALPPCPYCDKHVSGPRIGSSLARAAFGQDSCHQSCDEQAADALREAGVPHAEWAATLRAMKAGT